MVFNERIMKLRKKNNLLQREIADSIGVSLISYQRYEKNERQPTLPILIALAEYFNVSLDYLVGLTDDSNNKIVVKEIELPADEEQLLDCYRDCDPDAKKYLISKAIVLSIEGVPDKVHQEEAAAEEKGKLLA